VDETGQEWSAGFAQEHPMDRLLLRVPEAADVAGISRSLAYELIRTGQMPSVRVGRSIRVPADGLKRWVDALIQDTDEEGEPRLVLR
jgi:excisionase family DNA binding protein